MAIKNNQFNIRYYYAAKLVKEEKTVVIKATDNDVQGFLKVQEELSAYTEKRVAISNSAYLDFDDATSAIREDVEKKKLLNFRR